MGRDNESAISFKRGTDTNPLTELFDVVLRAHKLGVRTCIPATVQTYDPITQKATVLLGALKTRLTESGEIPNLPLPVFVPVRWPRTKGGYMTFPLIPGDTGHIVISDRSLEQWLQFGVPTDPGLRHTHREIDGIFEPGLHPDIDPIIPPTDLTGVVIEGQLIKAGVGATEAAVFGTIFTTLYNDLVTKFNAHTHITTATIDAGPPGVLAPPTSSASPMVPGTHTSTKVLIG